MSFRKSTLVFLAFVVCVVCLAGRAGGDQAEELEESLRQAEISFAASLADQDFKAFGDHIAENAVFVSGPPLIGREAILEAWSVYFSATAPKLRWQPEISIVQPSGRLGFSRGPYTLEITAADGEVSTRSGEFMSIWQLEEDGTWKVVFDSGCPPCEECGSS